MATADEIRQISAQQQTGYSVKLPDVSPELITALTARHARIQQRWREFLRVEPVASPLGDPKTLVFGIEGYLREIFGLLWYPPADLPEEQADCACGRNPLRGFFVAGEQALMETLVLEQAGRPALARGDRAQDAAELRRAVRFVAHRELSALAGLCQLPPPAAGRGAG